MLTVIVLVKVMFILIALHCAGPIKLLVMDLINDSLGGGSNYRIVRTSVKSIMKDTIYTVQYLPGPID